MQLPLHSDMTESSQLHDSSRGIAALRRLGRPHPCPFCNKVFPFKSILRNHLRIHTGEKPYACRVCGRSFNHCSNYYKHERACALKLAESAEDQTAAASTVLGGDPQGEVWGEPRDASSQLHSSQYQQQSTSQQLTAQHTHSAHHSLHAFPSLQQQHSHPSLSQIQPSVQLTSSSQQPSVGPQVHNPQYPTRPSNSTHQPSSSKASPPTSSHAPQHRISIIPQPPSHSPQSEDRPRESPLHEQGKSVMEAGINPLARPLTLSCCHLQGTCVSAAARCHDMSAYTSGGEGVGGGGNGGGEGGGGIRRLLECEHCHKHFTSRFNLQRHQLIHTGAKPYECPLCHQRFNQSGHVKTHLRTRHPTQEAQTLADLAKL
nr:zinc finger protein CKR1-like [Penaeus vannamei]